MRSLYSLVAAAALVVGVTGVASAADMPAKARPMPPATTGSWEGLYFGAHIGAAFGTIESGVPAPPFPIVSAAVNGFIGGGQIGYNFQSGPVVFGVELDASGSGLKGTAPCLIVLTCDRKVDWFGTVTGRVGFTADRALIYVKGGGAWANFDYNTSLVGVGIASANEDKWGWVVGAGIEYAFMPNWSAKLEYNFMDFGKDTIVFNTVGGGTVNVDSQQYIHAVKFGVNYRLGGPIYARY